MGLCTSLSSTPAERELVKVSKQLDAGLRNEAKADKNKIKLLLLGAGESGKSTIFKQMKIIYGKQYSHAERKQNLPTIHSNIIQAMHILIKHAKNIGNGDQTVHDQIECKEALAIIEALDIYEGLNLERSNAIIALWADPAIQQVWARRNETQITESVKYFFNKMEIIKVPNYVPDKDDMLHCRFRTSGIVTDQYLIDGMIFEMYDVGGQRNERRKWIHCFESVTGIIFVAGLSEYNQVLFESKDRNRMDEALDLFEDVCNNSCFARSSIILFLNKRDLFEEKIKNSDISDFFSEYKGAKNDYDAGIKFFLIKFLARNHSSHAHQVYYHVTCATDTRNIQIVFQACKDIIFKDNLKRSGIIAEDMAI
ncbi:unnamed protein product [Symbiodinium microadriaticum]|nr:unnamed protein product [Symbiodinium microadriaticum]